MTKKWRHKNLAVGFSIEDDVVPAEDFIPGDIEDVYDGPDLMTFHIKVRDGKVVSRERIK